MRTEKHIEKVRQCLSPVRSQGRKIGFVPTMGALHQGHMSLISRAREKCDFVVVSIFVNPAQFAPNEDLDKYPRQFEADQQMCLQNGVDLLFAPDVNEMYPQENLCWVTVEKLTDKLCGAFRPGHFRGVTTVCAKLFNIVAADTAFFGQKDAQQAVVIKKMVRDLHMDLDIEICPIVRQPDGLAVSSRNKYLDSEQRKDACVIYRALEKCSRMFKSGEKDSANLILAIKAELAETGTIEPEYVKIVDMNNLEDVKRADRGDLAAIAAYAGGTRLIDNIIL